MGSMIIAVLSAFFATLGFAILYNVRGKNLFIASLCGAFGWICYLVCDAFVDSTMLPYFVAGASIALYSEIAAYAFHSPATLFLTPGFIPLVPGGAVYRAMEACLQGDISGFAEGMVNTLKIGGSIVLGIILMSSLFRLIRSGIKTVKTKNAKIKRHS